MQTKKKKQNRLHTFLFLGKFRAAVRTRALCSQVRGCEARRRNDAMRTKDNEINLFKIQIKYKFAVAYCLLLLLRFRWLRFAKLISHCFFFFFFSSARFRSEHFGSECNFISKIKRTRLIVWLLDDGFS